MMLQKKRAQVVFQGFFCFPLDSRVVFSGEEKEVLLCLFNDALLDELIDDGLEVRSLSVKLADPATSKTSATVCRSSLTHQDVPSLQSLRLGDADSLEKVVEMVAYGSATARFLSSLLRERHNGERRDLFRLFIRDEMDEPVRQKIEEVGGDEEGVVFTAGEAAGNVTGLGIGPYQEETFDFKKKKKKEREKWNETN